METDRIIASIASQQHSIVTRPQLIDAGVRPGAIDRRVASGRLVVVHAGVYRPDGHPHSFHQRLMAATLAAGGVASHRAAAYLLGVPGMESPVEISIATSRRLRMSGVRIHRTGQLEPPDITTVDGVPSTRAARTLIDLAGVLAPATLAVTLDDLLSRRLMTVDYLRRRLDALGRQGRRGAGVLSELLIERADGRPRTTSEFERRLLAELTAARLPPPRTQFEVLLPNGRRVVLDYAYPEVLLGLEANSYRHHSSRTDWGRDNVRNRMLAAIGWRILPVTWDDLAAPADMVDAITRGLDQNHRSTG